jgi:hypothetical protein
MELTPRIAPMRNYNSSNKTRKCKKCENWLDLSCFSTRVRMPSSSTKDPDKKVPTVYYREVCKTCSLKTVKNSKYSSPEARKKRHRKDPRIVMLLHAKSRAKKNNLDFNIDLSDVIIPERCPLLDIPIYVHDKHAGANSPTIDKIIPSKGYVKGNVMVVSYKANTVKNDLTIEQLELLVNRLKRVLDKEEELLES